MVVLPTDPLGNALVETLYEDPNLTFPLGTALVEAVCGDSSPVAGFCLGTQAFCYILRNLGGSCQLSFTLAFCAPAGGTLRGSCEGLQRLV